MRILLSLPWLALALMTPAASAAELLPQRADEALRRAVSFFHQQVAAHGGYVYRYSADLQKREGEGRTGPDTVWVQPPGTPAVGLAYLDAYEKTSFPPLLDAARAAGECLIRGQLRSGGWSSSIEFSEAARQRISYRVDPPRSKGSNTSTLDDDKTQSALRFLIQLDRVLGFQEARVHEAVVDALDSVLEAQFANGGWPQGYREPADPALYPPRQASYPESWSREYPGGSYTELCTLNDNAIRNTIDMLFLAARVYDEPRYRAAAVRGGQFLLLAQLPEPQPAWAQQYDREMHPAWARKFEPPAVTGGESQGVIEILMQVYTETADRRFLEPIPRALAYLRRSARPDGRLARFYELRTNRPLYFTRSYELTYDDGDMPTHYGFIVGSKVDSLERKFQQLSQLSADELARRRVPKTERLKPSSSLEAAADAAIRALDARGAWVENGRLRYHGSDDDTTRVIETTTFIKNLGALSRYLSTVK